MQGNAGSLPFMLDPDPKIFPSVGFKQLLQQKADSLQYLHNFPRVIHIWLEKGRQMVDHWPLQERGGNQIGPWRRAGNQN